MKWTTTRRAAPVPYYRRLNYGAGGGAPSCRENRVRGVSMLQHNPGLLGFYCTCGRAIGEGLRRCSGRRGGINGRRRGRSRKSSTGCCGPRRREEEGLSLRTVGADRQFVIVAAGRDPWPGRSAKSGSWMRMCRARLRTNSGRGARRAVGSRRSRDPVFEACGQRVPDALAPGREVPPFLHPGDEDEAGAARRSGTSARASSPPRP